PGDHHQRVRAGSDAAQPVRRPLPDGHRPADPQRAARVLRRVPGVDATDHDHPTPATHPRGRRRCGRPMMSTTQLAVVLGLGAGSGLILLFRELIGRRTRQLHPAHTAARLTGTATATADLVGDNGYTDRLGRVVLRRAAGAALLHVPHRDLALLRKSVPQFLGERALYGAIGLCLPWACTLSLA